MIEGDVSSGRVLVSSRVTDRSRAPGKAELTERLSALIQKAEVVLSAQYDPFLERTGFPRTGAPQLWVRDGPFTAWYAQALAFLESFLGNSHPYTMEFRPVGRISRPVSVERGLGILRALVEDIESGYLAEVRTLIAAEVFDDFLDMAGHLFESGYKDSAAMLTGAVLEDGLRRISQANDVKVKRGDNISALNSRLLQADVYNKIAHKRVQRWGALRDSADHGHFDDYSAEEVAQMIEDTRSFLDEYLG